MKEWLMCLNFSPHKVSAVCPADKWPKVQPLGVCLLTAAAVYGARKCPQVLDRVLGRKETVSSSVSLQKQGKEYNHPLVISGDVAHPESNATKKSQPSSSPSSSKLTHQKHTSPGVNKAFLKQLQFLLNIVVPGFCRRNLVFCLYIH